MRPKALRWSALGFASVVVLGSGTAYAVTGGDPAAHYRTVAATVADVEQTLSTTGLVDAAKRADLAFGTGGTLASLAVELGDTVKAGQVIGRLDTTDLDAALTQAKAELARAVAQLASDRASQAAAVSDSSTPTTPSAASTPTSNDSSTSAANAALIRALKKAQDQVILIQSHASQALAAAKEALAAQQQACAEPAPADPSAPTEGAADDACEAALAAVQHAQQVVGDAQDALAKALDALGRVLGQALDQAQNQSDDQSPSQPQATSSPKADTTDDSSAASSPTGGGGTVTAAQLASDQAKIEQANASVISARQNRGLATLRATRSGTVVALDVAVGDTVTAGTTVATVVGGSAVTVTGTVSESQVDSVKVGQVVRVSVPGIARTTTGKVTAIGLVADSSSGTTSYPVTVTVENPTISLPAGSRALMKIVLATARDVVTVPTSALTRTGTGSTATVRTWNGSTLSRKTVQVGAVGAREVAITSGLTAGTRVVLAAIDDPIKGASTEVNDRGGFIGPAIQFRGPAGGGPATFSKAG